MTGVSMMNGFEDFQKFGKDNMDVMMQSFGAMTKGMQAIASALEKLVSAKSLDKAFEAQSEYVKGAYESFVGEATKIGEMYSEIAKESYKSYEGALSKAAK
jgi:hypothetical protein